MKKIADIISLPLVLSVLMIITVYVKSKTDIQLFIIMLIYLPLTVIIFILSCLFKKKRIYISLIIIWLILPMFFLRLKDICNSYDYFKEMINDNTGLIGKVETFPVLHNAKKETVISVIAVKKTDTSDYLKSIKKFRILLKINDINCPVDKGNIITINKSFILPQNKIFNFSYRENLFYKNIYGIIRCDPDDIEITNNKIFMPFFTDLIKSSLCRVREKILKMICAELNGQSFLFIQSVFFGIRSGLDEEINRQFINTGMIHLLAISGFNFGFLGIIIFKIFNLIISKSKSLMISIVFLSVYIFIISESASSQRAFYMYIISTAFFIAGITSAGMSILSISAVILCFINPFFVFDLGFQFSFFATAGILLFNNIIKDKLFYKIPEKIKNLISVTLSAFLSVFMLQWAVFEKVPFFSLLSSIIVVPLFSFVFTVLFFLIIFSLFFKIMIIFKIIELICYLFLKLISLLDIIPSVELIDIPGYFSVIFFIFLIVYFYCLDPYMKKAVVYLRIKLFSN